jgi:hypothetical protein
MKKLVLFAAVAAVVALSACKKAEAPVEAVEETVIEEVAVPVEEVVDSAAVAVDAAAPAAE